MLEMFFFFFFFFVDMQQLLFWTEVMEMTAPFMLGCLSMYLYSSSLYMPWRHILFVNLHTNSIT